MLYAGINKHQFISFRIKREIFVFQSFTVETDETAGLAEARCELIHDSAFDPAVIMLGALSDLRQFEFVDAVGKQLVDGKCKGAFKGCRR